MVGKDLVRKPDSDRMDVEVACIMSALVVVVKKLPVSASFPWINRLPIVLHKPQWMVVNHLLCLADEGMLGRSVL